MVDLRSRQVRHEAVRPEGGNGRSNPGTRSGSKPISTEAATSAAYGLDETTQNRLSTTEPLSGPWPSSPGKPSTIDRTAGILHSSSARNRPTLLCRVASFGYPVSLPTTAPSRALVARLTPKRRCVFALVRLTIASASSKQRLTGSPTISAPTGPSFRSMIRAPNRWTISVHPRRLHSLSNESPKAHPSATTRSALGCVALHSASTTSSTCGEISCSHVRLPAVLVFTKTRPSLGQATRNSRTASAMRLRASPEQFAAIVRAPPSRTACNAAESAASSDSGQARVHVLRVASGIRSRRCQLPTARRSSGSGRTALEGQARFAN